MEKNTKDDIVQIVVETLKSHGILTKDGVPPRMYAPAQSSPSVTTDKRLFELLEQRFNESHKTDKRLFELLEQRFNESHKDVNRQFAELRKDDNGRFVELWKDVNSRFTFMCMQGLIIGIFTLFIFLLTVYRFL